MPDSQVKTVLADLEKMIPQEVRKWVDWEQTKSDQGPFPSPKSPAVSATAAASDPSPLYANLGA